MNLMEILTNAIIDFNKPFNKTQKIRDARIKSLGRNLEFEPINEPFCAETDNHHPMYDKDGNVLPDTKICGWIFSVVHKSIPHNHKTGKGMRLIDKLFWECIELERSGILFSQDFRASLGRKGQSCTTLSYFTS
jgi:hypothetical protein